MSNTLQDTILKFLDFDHFVLYASDEFSGNTERPSVLLNILF